MTDKIMCGCGAESPDGYWPTKEFNTVDIDVESRIGNVWDDGMCVEGDTTTTSYVLCLACWRKLEVFLKIDLKSVPEIRVWEG